MLMKKIAHHSQIFYTSSQYIIEKSNPASTIFLPTTINKKHSFFFFFLILFNKLFFGNIFKIGHILTLLEPVKK